MKYSWGNYTTLIAEDDPLNFRYIELLLKSRTGINILWAKNGLEAINLCMNNRHIDVVLLDLQLPELDGMGSLRQIKKFNPFLPVIIQTANSWNNEEENCKKEGCNGFFNKPLNIEELLRHMEHCIESYSIHRETKISS